MLQLFSASVACTSYVLSTEVHHISDRLRTCKPNCNPPPLSLPFPKLNHKNTFSLETACLMVFFLRRDQSGRLPWPQGRGQAAPHPEAGGGRRKDRGGGRGRERRRRTERSQRDQVRRRIRKFILKKIKIGFVSIPCNLVFKTHFIYYLRFLN